jgi:hypothetical protein
MSELQSPTTTHCPCGAEVDISVITIPPSSLERYHVCGAACEECGRRSGGGNMLTGEVTEWRTPQQVASAQANYDAQLFDAEQNALHGRGNW